MREELGQEREPQVERRDDAAVAEPAPEPIRFRDGRPESLDVPKLLRLQGTAGNAAVARLVRTERQPAQPPGPVIQRYQAGERGHGGIEEEALHAAGFGTDEHGRDEAREIYVGNWMRDLSQLNSPAMRPIIRLLALGEFGHEVPLEELGGYVPSEHLDNPAGGGTIEDEEFRRRDPAGWQAAFDRLSPAQQAAFRDEESRRDEILDAQASSHLPDYIERGKMHAKDTLGEAVDAGRTEEGRRLMGDALHAVEDYYSHSNFVEACILTLEHEGDPSVASLSARLRQTYLGQNLAFLVPERGGEMQIQTGTYAGDANGRVSQLELLETELTNGELTRAFILGWIRSVGMTGEQLLGWIGSRLGGGIGAVLGGVVGGVGGLVGGAVTGAAGGASSGASSGWEAGERLGGGGILGGVLGAGGAALGAVGGFVGGLFGGAAHGAVEGATEGAHTGSDLGSRAGGAVLGGVGRAVGDIVGALSIGTLLALFSPFIVPIVTGAIAAAKAGLLERWVEHETERSGGEARRAGLQGPTHSELAKDDPGHPLWEVSRAMAVEADTEIGRAMIALWGGGAYDVSDQARDLSEDPDAEEAGGSSSSNGSANGSATGNGHGPTSGPLFYAEVDKRFWARTSYKVGERLDPKLEEDKPYVRRWLSIRDEVKKEREGGGGAATVEAPPVPEAGPQTDAGAPGQATIDALVDKYVCHPSQTTWWREVLRRYAS